MFVFALSSVSLLSSALVLNSNLSYRRIPTILDAYKGTKSPVAGEISSSVYSRPSLYDLAVSYRDYHEEVRFLLHAHEKHSMKSNGGGPLKILELAAGPARHCLNALRHFSPGVATCTAVDTSKEMMDYSNELANEELGDLRDKFNYINEDMRRVGVETDDSPSFLKAKSFDCAWILLGSLQYLISNDDVISCLKSTANLLCDGGTLTVELPHPREVFTMGECTRNGWEMPLQDECGENYGELKIIWGDDNDAFDPIRQVRDFTIVMDLIEDNSENGEKSGSTCIREVAPTRIFTAQEIDVLGRIAGFEVVQMYGAI